MNVDCFVKHKLLEDILFVQFSLPSCAKSSTI
jgi:hypothetical protein